MLTWIVAAVTAFGFSVASAPPSDPHAGHQHPDVRAGKAKKYRCTVSEHIYDPEEGDPKSDIPPGTAFEDLPDTWSCPECGASKDDFEPLPE